MNEEEDKNLTEMMIEEEIMFFSGWRTKRNHPPLKSISLQEVGEYLFYFRQRISRKLRKMHQEEIIKIKNSIKKENESKTNN